MESVTEEDKVLAKQLSAPLLDASGVYDRLASFRSKSRSRSRSRSKTKSPSPFMDEVQHSSKARSPSPFLEEFKQSTKAKRTAKTEQSTRIEQIQPLRERTLTLRWMGSMRLQGTCTQ